MSGLANRCRLVLVANSDNVSSETLIAALSGGDVASVILHADDAGAVAFEQYCKDVVPEIQSHDVAALVTDNSRAFGRSGADGIFADREKPKLEDFIARFSPHNIVGCGNIKNRHGALQAGELKPDFLFFGKPGGDIRPEPHRKNLDLAEWWSELVQISAIVMGGNGLNSVIDCAKTGAEFVALGKAVFDHEDGAEMAVRHANALLDEHAPLLDVEDA